MAEITWKSQQKIDEEANAPQLETAEEKIARLEAETAVQAARIAQQEIENANLCYQAMISESKAEASEQEIADLWYEIMTIGSM